MLRAFYNAQGKIRGAGGGGRGSQQGNGGTPAQAVDTWNPATKGTSVVLSNGNLTANVATFGNMVFSITNKTTGKWYAEILIGTQTSLTSSVAGLARTTVSGNSNWAIDSTVILLQNLGGSAVNCASGAVSGTGNLVAGDVMGIAYDCSTGVCQFYRNNSANGSGTTTVGAGMRLCAAQNWNPETKIFTIRTTSAEFSYTPPTGYLPWGTI